VRADDLGTLRFIRNKVVDLRDRSVEDRDLVAVIVHIQNKVLAHHSQPDQSDVTCSLLHKRLLTNSVRDPPSQVDAKSPIVLTGNGASQRRVWGIVPIPRGAEMVPSWLVYLFYIGRGLDYPSMPANLLYARMAAF
jgi:hypothetical protein